MELFLMIRRNPVMSFLTALAIVGLLDLLLLISGYRILVGEREWSEYTEFSKFTDSTLLDSGLECRYFTGRSVQTARVSWSQSKVDECPFV